VLSISDAVIDNNRNGLFESMVVTARVDVQEPAKYSRFVELQDSEGQHFSNTGLATLGVGAGEVQVVFDTKTLRDLSVIDGPWEYAVVSLKQVSSAAHGDRHNGMGRTSAYRIADFDRGPIYFTGAAAAEFRGPRVSLGVYSDSARWCLWGVTLRGAGGKDIDFVSNHVLIPKGLSSIRGTFKGALMAQAGPESYTARGGKSCGQQDVPEEPSFVITNFAPSQFAP
jgi:hypothetical protein